MFDQVLTVSAASELINETLQAALPALIIEGEVSGFNVNRGKFVFFDLKDDDALLPCFMMLFHLKIPLEDGMKVRALVEPGLTAKGRFSLTVRQLQPVGEGSLKKAFEQLRRQLESEGLFSADRKRRLPKYPQKIAVVSSSGAAGWADFTKILNERWGGLDVTLADVAVQGLQAPTEIMKAIEYFNGESRLADVLVVIRGGGSVDDLAAFDHPDVVRAVAASRVPTVVAIGHETDESLAELAADVRASTPSNAAQFLVPDKHEIILNARRVTQRAANGVDAALNVFEQDRIAAVERIEHYLQQHLEQAALNLKRTNQTLRQLSPEAALRRGYALVRAGDGRVISRAQNVTLGSEISIAFSDGNVGAEVNNVTKK